MTIQLKQFGIWTSYRAIGEDNAGKAAKLVEDLGFSALWLGGSPRLASVRPLLVATERLIVATGIVNVWQYEPAQLAAEHAELAREFPGRLLVGIGIGHPEATGEYSRPLAKMSEFLDGLDRADVPVRREERCLAALGPKMLDLCAARSRGAHTYFVPVEHTRFARERVGGQTLIATELACVPSAGTAPRRDVARKYAQFYLGLRNYVSNLLRFGFTKEDIGGGSDRLIDAIVPQGNADRIATVAREHLDAGASHVCLQAVGTAGIPRAEWTALASALIG